MLISTILSIYGYPDKMEFQGSDLFDALYMILSLNRYKKTVIIFFHPFHIYVENGGEGESDNPVSP